MAGMTKRHFQAIANVIASYGPAPATGDPEHLRRQIASDLATICRGENPQFDRQRFLKACEVF